MSTATSLDVLLDDGVRGLGFFAEFLPCAHRWGVAGRITDTFLRERYDEQRGFDASVLADDGAALARLSDELRLRLDEQTSAAGALRFAWEGGAGATAHCELANTAVFGSALEHVVSELTGAYARAATDVVAAVADKAFVVGGFAGATVGGRTADEVHAVITEARGQGEAAAWCELWMDEVFVPELLDRIERFLDVCETADTIVDDALAGIVRMLGAIDALGASSGASSVGFVGAGGNRPSEPPTVLERPGGPASPRTVIDAGAALVAAVDDLARAVGGLAAAATDGVAAVADLVDAAVHPVPPVSEPEGTVPEAEEETVPVVPVGEDTVGEDTVDRPGVIDGEHSEPARTSEPIPPPTPEPERPPAKDPRGGVTLAEAGPL